MEKKDTSYRRFMMKLSKSLTQDDIDYLKYFYGKYVPAATGEKIVKGIDLFTVLERANLLGPDKMDTLRVGFETISRGDLMKEIEYQVEQLKDEFKEVQQSMKETLEEYADNFMEHDGPRDEKQNTDDIETNSSGEASFVMRHGNPIKGKKLKELRGDSDEWTVEAELQVDVNDGTSKDTKDDKSDAHDDIGVSEVDDVVPDGGSNNQPGKKLKDFDKCNVEAELQVDVSNEDTKDDKSEAHEDIGISKGGDVVPDGSGNNQPDITSQADEERPQNFSKIPAEIEDEDTVNIKGQVIPQDPLQQVTFNTSAPSSSDNELVNGNEADTSEDPPSGASSTVVFVNSTPHKGFGCIKPAFHGDGVPSGLESDEEPKSEHSTGKPSEDVNFTSHQVGKMLPVGVGGSEEDGPGGLATSDFGSYVFNGENNLGLSGANGFPSLVQAITCGSSSSYGTLGAAKSNSPGHPEPPIVPNPTSTFNCNCGGVKLSWSSEDTLPVSMLGASLTSAGCASNLFPDGAISGVYSTPCNSELQTGSINSQTIPTAACSTGRPSPNCTIRDGFQVEIPEGKHEEDADGDKVIMPKNGMNFRIIVINRNQFNADLDIYYGNTLLGWWVLEPGIPLPVAGPTYEKGKLFYSANDRSEKNKSGSTPSNLVKCVIKPDSEALKINVETTHRQRMKKERFEVLWGKSQSFQTLQENLQQRIRESISGIVAHNQIQDPSKKLSDAGIMSGDTVHLLFSEFCLCMELPDGQLLDPETIEPLTVEVDDIKCYVQGYTDKHPTFQRLSFQERTITQREDLIPVFLSENPIIRVDFAEKLMLRVKYDNTETKITENTFSTVKTLKDKMEQEYENTIVLKFKGEILDDESKLLHDCGIDNNAIVEVVEVEQRRGVRSVMRGGNIDAFGFDDDDDEEEDELENLFPSRSRARGFSNFRSLESTSGSRFRGNGGGSSVEYVPGKVSIEGDVDTNDKFIRDEEYRTFQEELKVEIVLQLVTEVQRGASAQST